MMQHTKTMIAIAVGVMVVAWRAEAHPHVWTVVETEVLYNDHHAITGFRHKWTFDEFYSAFAVQGYPKNKAGGYDRETLQELAEVNVQSLKEFGFFTFPKLGDQVIERRDPVDYWLDYENGVLVLHFTLPLAEPVPAAHVATFDFAVYDPTYYVSFTFAEKAPVRLAAGAPTGCAPKFTDPEPQEEGALSMGEAFFNNLDAATANFGAQFAQTVTISCGAG